MNNIPNLLDLLIKQNKKSQKLEYALRNIFINTYNRDFGKDAMYRAGVLMNIKVAVGEDLYNEWIELYT